MIEFYPGKKAREAFDRACIAAVEQAPKLAMGAAVVALAALAMAPESLVAGTGGTEFDNVWTWLVDVTQGTLGRIVAGSMVLVGVIGGIARQSLMAFATGIAGALGLNYAPDIIDAVMSATINAVHLPVM